MLLKCSTYHNLMVKKIGFQQVMQFRLNNVISERSKENLEKTTKQKFNLLMQNLQLRLCPKAIEGIRNRYCIAELLVTITMPFTNEYRYLLNDIIKSIPLNNSYIYFISVRSINFSREQRILCSVFGRQQIIRVRQVVMAYKTGRA